MLLEKVKKKAFRLAKENKAYYRIVLGNEQSGTWLLASGHS
jgi:hypothetical protein